MTGADIAIDDASAADTVLSVKERVFAANRQLPVRRQRLVYRPGPHGINPLADDETLGGAGVAQDGSAELDVLLTEVSAEEAAELAEKVSHKHPIVLVSCVLIGSRIHIICFSADQITARHVLMNICCVFRILCRRCDEN